MLSNPMTMREINYQMATLRNEKQKLLERMLVINDDIHSLAKLRTRQQLEQRLMR